MKIKRTFLNISWLFLIGLCGCGMKRVSEVVDTWDRQKISYNWSLKLPKGFSIHESAEAHFPIQIRVPNDSMLLRVGFGKEPIANAVEDFVYTIQAIKNTDLPFVCAGDFPGDVHSIYFLRQDDSLSGYVTYFKEKHHLALSINVTQASEGESLGIGFDKLNPGTREFALEIIKSIRFIER